MHDVATLADVLRLPPLAAARVVGGHRGLGRPVRAVNVMEVPDILDWVKPDELLLTTAYPLRDDPAALEELVPHLAERRLAGIAIKPARYIETIPARMIEAADRHDFPLIELPSDASFNEIIQAVLTVILNNQSALLERSAAIHDRFTTIVLSGGGLREIAEALAELVGLPVAIVDAQGVVQCRSSDGAPRGEIDDTEDGSRSPIVQPIQVGGERYGTILVADDGRELGSDRLEAIEYAATVAALRQVQARAVAEADWRFQAVCLEELVTGHITERSVLMERATTFAWDLATPRAVLLAEAEGGTLEDGPIRSRLADAARASLGPGAIIWERSREIGALVAAVRPSDVRDAGTALQAEAARRLPGLVVGIGIGRVSPDPLRLNVSYTEARRALTVGRWGHGPGRLTAFEELGIDRLLASVPDAEIAAFGDAVLGRLEAYDAARATNLVATLEAFLESRNVALAARGLYVHYNTLKNRLVKIEEIIGPYLDDPDRCLSLSLALRLRRLPTP